MDANLATPNSVFRFKDGTSRNTARISKAKWEEHKELLRSLYQEKIINEILAFMQKEHAFIVNAGQLGRKLREWGVYKYDNKNRLLNPKLPPSDHRNIGRSFEEALSYSVSEDLPVPLDFGEVLPVYDGGTFIDTRPVERSGATTTASNHVTPSIYVTQVRSSQDSGAHKEDAVTPIHVDTSTSVELPTPVKLPTVMNEPDHTQLSDFDMDRLSAISITSSEISDFSSLLSLAQRIRLGQTGGTSSGRDIVNDLPSSAMGWNKRISSLYLFGRRSIASSIASSQETSSSRMSWRPEMPATHNPSRSDMKIEPARMPRRPGMEWRQTIGYPVSQGITKPYESGRRIDLINQPLSPVLTRQGGSPGFSRRRESQVPQPKCYYPDKFGRMDCAPDDYVDPMGLENRLRKDDWRMQGERSKRREDRGPPPEWYYCRGARYGADIRPHAEGVAWWGDGQMRTEMGDISEGRSTTRFNKQLERGERRRSGVDDIARADRCI